MGLGLWNDWAVHDLRGLWRKYRMNKKSKKPELKMVAVLAMDWSYSTECIKMDHCQLPMPAWCVGLLTHEDGDFIEIAQQHFYKNESKRNVLTLTKSSIVKIFELKTGNELKVKKSIFQN